jgi:tRNA uridine 5-carboxymethylaminomethyl modification enzyme
MGVLVDDLVSLGTKEPYRMFTSRAEYRLIMREDNADMRLTETGKRLGLVQDKLWEAYTNKRNTAQKELERLEKEKISPKTKEADFLEKETGETLNSPKTLKEILKRPRVFYNNLPGRLSGIKRNAIDEIEASVKYAGYIERQKTDIARLQKNENTKIPNSVKYENVVGLSNEVRQKLSEAKPQSLARASRLPGITPAAISLLMVHLKKERKRKAS